MSGNIQNRRNWTRSLTIILLVAVIGAVIGCLANTKTVTTDRVYLRSTAGAVLFDHGEHASSADSCATCHHDLYASELATSCEECHDDEFTPNDVSHAEMKEIHNRDCTTCHEQVTPNDQAASCRECHPGMQPEEKNTLNCTECHDDDYTPDMMTHDEYLEVSDHACLGCHAPQSVSEVYHTNCSSCHLDTNPDRFTDAGGELLCGACHLP